MESADSKSKGEQKKRQMLIIHKKKKRNVKNLWSRLRLCFKSAIIEPIKKRALNENSAEVASAVSVWWKAEECQIWNGRQSS